MSKHIWVEPTDNGATIKTGSEVPATATKTVKESTDTAIDDMEASILGRNSGSPDYASVPTAEEALASQEIRTLAGIKP